MSRAVSGDQRNLSLTEELERLEQSITLTLQEIDHNFSRAHRIVTTSILPIVEQYAEHSREVWEGSKFWKEFFEASANVSLSGYEEQPVDETNDMEQTVTEESTNTTNDLLDDTTSHDDSSAHHAEDENRHGDEDLDLSSMTISPSHSTPRPTARSRNPDDDDTDILGSSVDYPSPYEALRREVEDADPSVRLHKYDEPTTPGKAPSGFRHTREMAAATPESSPYRPPPSATMKLSTAKKYQQNTSSNDPLLHRVLDKTYRIQATPLKGASQFGTKNRFTTPGSGARTRKVFDSSPPSSPEMEAPQLHAEIFSSPQRAGYYSSAKKARTPGVSVLTPAAKNKFANVGGAAATSTKGKSKAWESDDEYDAIDDDDSTSNPYGQFGSPPKTMQFHIPQSRLMKTPAKEASKRIVNDLLLNAGGGPEITDDDIDLTIPADAGEARYGGEGDEEEFELTLDIDEEEPVSPSLVRKTQGYEDMTF